MSRINIKNDFQDGNTLYGDELNINNNVIMAGVNDNYERIVSNDDDITALGNRVTQNESDIISLNTNKANKTDVAASIADLEDRKANKTDVAASVADLESRKANKTDVAASVASLENSITGLNNSKADKTSLNDYYTKSQVDSTLSSYATKTYVSEAIEEAIDIPPETIEELKELAENLDDIAMKDEIPTKTSDLTNDSGFVTSSAVAAAIAANNPKVKTITLATSGWVQNQTTELYEYTINDSDVTANHFIDLTGTIENQILDGCEVQSYAGYYIIRTTKSPESNIDATVKIELTNPVVSGGSL